MVERDGVLLRVVMTLVMLSGITVLLIFANHFFRLGEGWLTLLALLATPLLLWPVFSLHRLAYNNGRLQRQLVETQHERATFHGLFAHAKRIASLGSWELDLRSGALVWSDEVYAMYGMVPGQALDKKTVQAAIYWADRDEYFQALERALKEGEWLDREFRVGHPGGGIHVLHDRGEPLYDTQGRIERLIGVTTDITSRIQAEFKLRNAHMEFHRILDHMQDTYYRADPVGRLGLVSNSMAELLGYQPHEAVGIRIADLYALRRHGQSFLRDLHSHGGRLRNYEIEMKHRLGHSVWVSLNAQFILDEKGKTIGIEGTIRDISELNRARQALHKEKELALVTLQSIGDGVITTDKDGLITYLNPTAENLLAGDSKTMLGVHFHEVLPLVDEITGESLGDLVQMCMSLDSSHAQVDDGMLIRKDGSRFHIKVTTAAMHDHFGQLVGAVLVLHDITEVMNMANQLSYQASHDMLTGLYNRRVFEKRLEDLIRLAAEGGRATRPVLLRSRSVQGGQ